MPLLRVRTKNLPHQPEDKERVDQLAIRVEDKKREHFEEHETSDNREEQEQSFFEVKKRSSCQLDPNTQFQFVRKCEI